MQTTTQTRHRVTRAPAMTFAGFSRRYRMGQKDGFVDQWKTFTANLGMIADQAYDPGTIYGVCYNFDAGSYDYMCAVEVQEDADPFEDFQYVETLARDYAVFLHEGMIDTIDQTWAAIKAQPELNIAQAPSFEKYLPGFDHHKPGHVEIWIPLATSAA